MKPGQAGTEHVDNLRHELLPTILADYPGIHVRWEGQQEQQAESFQSMAVGFAVAIMAMYVLLSFEFKSYLQPLLILAIIPFGMIGAVCGHFAHGTATDHLQHVRIRGTDRDCD